MTQQNNQPEILPDEEIESRVKDALVKDFNALYVPQFTTAWHTERIVRELEIDVMSFANTVKAIRQIAQGYRKPEPVEGELREQIANIIAGDEHCDPENCALGEDDEPISCEYCRADSILAKVQQHYSGYISKSQHEREMGAIINEVYQHGLPLFAEYLEATYLKPQKSEEKRSLKEGFKELARLTGEYYKDVDPEKYVQGLKNDTCAACGHEAEEGESFTVFLNTSGDLVAYCDNCLCAACGKPLDLSKDHATGPDGKLYHSGAECANKAGGEVKRNTSADPEVGME